MLRIGQRAAVKALFLAVFCAGIFLLTPALATADSTVHGNVYDWSTFETMNNAVVEVYSMPDQAFIERAVVKSGSYTFSLPGGSYTLKAKAGTPGTLSELVATDNITVAENDDYVIDLILFPPTGLEDLETMNDSGINSSLTVTPTAPPGLQPTPSPAQGDSSLLIYLGLGALGGIIVIGIIAAWLMRRPKKASLPETVPEIRPAPAEEKPTEPATAPEENAEPPTETTDIPALPAQPAQPPAAGVSVKEQLLPQDCREVIAIIEKHGGRITQLDLRKALPYSEAKVSLIVSDLESRGILKKIKKGRGNVLILNYHEDQPGK